MEALELFFALNRLTPWAVVTGRVRACDSTSTDPFSTKPISFQKARGIARTELVGKSNTVPKFMHPLFYPKFIVKPLEGMLPCLPHLPALAHLPHPFSVDILNSKSML